MTAEPRREIEQPRNMGKPTPAISVAVLDNTAFIKIPGRANFNSSVDF